MNFFECGNIDFQSFVLIFFYGKKDEKVNIFLHTQDCFDISSTVIVYTLICMYLKIETQTPFSLSPTRFFLSPFVKNETKISGSCYNYRYITLSKTWCFFILHYLYVCLILVFNSQYVVRGSFLLSKDYFSYLNTTYVCSLWCSF